ncbi:hypothetical protein [Lacticaseibacillus manihotivorans]|uniref:hypothetical protein n=1 Tax=Lacticaseibacillus manihotivorans TaxID=88233 RepID=UPI0006D1A147|nr:hypothetical protein [Lacticaseibacillus manihotivorans]
MSVNDLAHLVLNAPAFTFIAVFVWNRNKMSTLRKLVKDVIEVLSILDELISAVQHYWTKWTTKKAALAFGLA